MITKLREKRLFNSKTHLNTKPKNLNQNGCKASFQTKPILSLGEKVIKEIMNISSYQCLLNKRKNHLMT